MNQWASDIGEQAAQDSETRETKELSATIIKVYLPGDNVEIAAQKRGTHRETTNTAS